MFAFNIFTAIGKFFTDFLFIPLDAIRLGDLSWWAQNAVNWLFILIGFVMFAYWMKESKKFKTEGTEDLP